MSLQELCIKVIVREFDKYYIAFSKLVDPNLKRKFEFLQRVCSYQIASQLFESNKLKVDYIDFLINKHLKTLNAEWLKDCPWETVVEKFAEVGPNLQKVYFPRLWCSSQNTDRPWQDVIHHLRNLEGFFFPFKCSDEVLKCISQFCPNIVEIDASDSPNVSNKGIQYLCMKENGKPLCPKLRKLSIASSNVNEEGIKYLIQNLRSLEKADLQELPEVLFSLHKDDLSALNTVKPYKLTSLDILNMSRVDHYTNLLKVCLSVCPNLKFLKCDVSKKEHLDQFSSTLELEKLYLKGSSNKIDVTGILKMIGNKLTSLTVVELTFSVSSLSESCPCLKKLDLYEVCLQSDDDDASPLFKYLQSLSFAAAVVWDTITVKSVSLFLKYSPKLEHIVFDNTDLLFNELKTAILRCEYCPIKSVDFNDCIVDMHLIKSILLNFHTLDWFTLNNCGIHGNEKSELDSIAKLLPNTPVLCIINDHLSSSDSEEDSVDNLYDSDDFFAYDYDSDDFYLSASDYEYDSSDE